MYVFLTMLGLCCCVGFLELQQAGATLYCGARTSPCSGFSCCDAWTLGHAGFVVVAPGLF